MTTLTTSREITIMATKEYDEKSFKKKEKNCNISFLNVQVQAHIHKNESFVAR